MKIIIPFGLILFDKTSGHNFKGKLITITTEHDLLASYEEVLRSIFRRWNGLTFDFRQ